jgi:hypothetical protein
MAGMVRKCVLVVVLVVCVCICAWVCTPVVVHALPVFCFLCKACVCVCVCVIHFFDGTLCVHKSLLTCWKKNAEMLEKKGYNA